MLEVTNDQIIGAAYDTSGENKWTPDELPTGFLFDRDEAVRFGRAILALATHAGAAAEPVAWWRVSYIDREGNSDADVQIGKDKPTPQLLADNGFPWEPLYGAPLSALTSAPAEPPKGFVLVPVEPTAEMLAAGAECWHISKDNAEGYYRAMIAAAPGAPTETPPAAGAIDARGQEAPNPKNCTAKVRCDNGRIITESCTTKKPLIDDGGSSDGERDYYICPDCRKNITIDYREN